jgi:ABC-type amino acid transport substrate-binding protein
MNFNQRVIAIALCAAIGAGATSQAQACGEVMYRMGGALRYHAFITRHPAEILMYADAATLAEPSAHREEFHHNLEKAGHKVTVVAGPQELSQALAAHRYDVIIAYAASLPAINAQLAHAQREPSLIPVFPNGDEAARKQYPLALNEDANLNQFLKTIEQTMKSRGT